MNNEFSKNQIQSLLSISRIGLWVWNLRTDEVKYSKEYAKILGYNIDEVTPTVDFWVKSMHPQDLKITNDTIDAHIRGKNDYYTAEFRMLRKDGTVIWAQDKGKVTEYDKDGTPTVLCGVLQDITSIKNTEHELKNKQNILNLAIEVAEFGTWRWNLSKDNITYNRVFLQLLGYEKKDLDGSIKRWMSIIHPDDLDNTNKHLDDYLEGRSPSYQCDMRMRHRDGHYVWVRDIGRIVEWDSKGNPAVVLGGHISIDNLVRLQESQAEALEQLNDHKEHLEDEIEKRTKELTDQDRILLVVTQISQQLVSLYAHSELKGIVEKSLSALCKASNHSRISIWRNVTIDGELCCFTAYSYNYDIYPSVDNLRQILTTTDIEGITGGKFTNENADEFIEHLIKYRNDLPVSYKDFLPSFYDYVISDKTLNCTVSELSPTEQFYMGIIGIKSVLIAPITLNGTPWGFIGIDNCNQERKFSDIEERMLKICGSIFANAIIKSETQEELRIAHEDALMSNKAKSNFLANMSHEIRTPMNAISGMAEIILRESTGDTCREYAGDIKKSCDNLLTIINDILDISKIESGKLDISESSYNLTSLLHDIINISRMRLGGKALRFYSYIDSKLPSLLYGDEIRIKQILLNLLSNSIKFTESGHIGIKVYGEYADGVCYLCFDVFDSGIGIKEDDLKLLFEEFERVNTTKNRAIEGTGLGLAISKKICEMMGGSIEVNSVHGEGSTFTVKLCQRYDTYQPIAVCDKPKSVLLYESRRLQIDAIGYSVENLGGSFAVCHNQSQLMERLNERHFDFIFTPSLHLDKIKSIINSMDLKSKIAVLSDEVQGVSDDTVHNIILPANCIQICDIFNNIVGRFDVADKKAQFVAPTARVLIVDDNPVNLKVATGLMSPYQFTIETANNGAEAVEMVQQNDNYDLVFMDHMMPIMDGIDATIAIRKMQGDYFKQLPIVALTANAIVGTRELFIQEGMNDFLAKPIETTKLNDMLSRWIPTEKQKLAKKTVSVTEQQLQECELIIKGLNTTKALKLLGGSITTYRDIVKTYYRDGIKRVKSILLSYETDDVKSFKTEVHAIKSATASIGGDSLSEKARLLEDAAQKLDNSYIDANIKPFITEFEELLKQIDIALGLSQKISTATNKSGDILLLKNTLPQIEDAVGFVDMGLIERLVHGLMQFSWQEEITQKLVEIENHAASYEYDEILPLINDIRGCIVD